MELKTAIEILDYHQEWRLGKSDDMIHEPKKLTEALDIVLSEVKKLNIHTVSNRYDVDKFTPPFRVGRKQGRAVLDLNGLSVVFFEHSEKQAEMYCDYLNGC